MSLTRIATYFGALVLVLFVGAYLIAVPTTGGENPVATAIFVTVALAGLVAAGSMLYGRRSHYAAAAARNRTAQTAHDSAADLAADTRRASAEAAKRGERYCPLDPANLDAADRASVITNGHTPAPHAAPPPPPQQA